MSYVLAPFPKMQFFDDNGNPLAGGSVNTYAAGTSTPIVTFQDSIGTPNTNPVVLDSAGRANIWIDSAQAYKFVVSTRDGVQLYTVDNIGNAAAGVVTTVSIMDTLQLLNGSYNGQKVILSGYYSANDGGGGEFYYDSASNAVPDNGMVVTPPNGTGRWLRVADGYINPRWYGAKGDGITNDAAAFVSADTFCASFADPTTGIHEWFLLVKEGLYKISSAWTEKVRIKLEDGAILQTTGTFALKPIFNYGDLSQHFIVTSGSITLDLSTIYPEWFGAVGDPTFPATGADQVAAIQAAINAATSGTEIVFNGTKKYFSSALTLLPGIILRSSQAYENDSSNTPSNEPSANLQYAGGSGSSFFNLTNSGRGGIRGITAKNLIIDGNGPASQANSIFALDTAGSLISNCTIRNAAKGIVFRGTDYDSSKNRVVHCVFRNIAGPAIFTTDSDTHCTNGFVADCSFIGNANDVEIGTQSTNWSIVNNNFSANNGPVSGLVLSKSNEGITNYRNTILAGGQGNFALAERIGNWSNTSNSFGSSTNAWDHRFFVRTNGGPTFAGAGIHNGLGLDATPSPRTNSRAWYERWMDGSHHWGDMATELMNIDHSGNVVINGTLNPGTLYLTQNFSGSASLTPLSVVSNGITLTKNYHIVTMSTTTTLSFISTNLFSAGAVVAITFLATAGFSFTISHKVSGSAPSGFAKIGTSGIGGTPADRVITVANGTDMTFFFVYDGTYWKMINGVS
jgi:hypothetical protein